MPRGWFIYNPGTVTGGLSATGNWTYIGPFWECAGSGIACVAYAYYIPGPGIPVIGVTHPRPPFSIQLIAYINAAAASTQPLPLGPSKKYVYIKSE